MNARRLGAAALVATAVGACSDAPKPQPGLLEVSLQGTGSVRSARIMVAGPYVGVTSPGGGVIVIPRASQGDTLVALVFSPAGTVLNGDVILHLEVPDQNAVAGYTGVVLEAASPSHALRLASQYVLTIARP